MERVAYRKIPMWTYKKNWIKELNLASRERFTFRPKQFTRYIFLFHYKREILSYWCYFGWSQRMPFKVVSVCSAMLLEISTDDSLASTAKAGSVTLSFTLGAHYLHEAEWPFLRLSATLWTFARVYSQCSVDLLQCLDVEFTAGTRAGGVKTRQERLFLVWLLAGIRVKVMEGLGKGPNLSLLPANLADSTGLEFSWASCP